MEGKRLPIYLLPGFVIPHRSGASATTDEPTLTHRNHSKSLVYIRVHSWCCIFRGFGQRCNDVDPPSQYHPV